jgi:hypothetical protein
MSNSRLDQDSPWKDILRQYFQQALEFFFPQTATLVDWSRPYEFLDTEFQQIAPESETGKRYADQLVKVWLKRGQELWLLVHIEVQAKPEAHFAERMLVYHLRIFDRFHRHPTSLAILCDSSAQWRPTEYHYADFQTELSFRFGSAKLLDYRQRWSELESSRNPFAVVVMAHLQAQETKRKARTRKDYKLNLIRRLYEQGYQQQEILNLFRFIDWVMMLPEGLKHEFWQQLKTYEQEQRMPYITSIEEIGFERGLEQGLEHERSLILRLLSRKIGSLDTETRTQVEALTFSQLETLTEALLDFNNQDDLARWLAAQGR